MEWKLDTLIKFQVTSSISFTLVSMVFGCLLRSRYRLNRSKYPRKLEVGPRQVYSYFQSYNLKIIVFLSKYNNYKITFSPLNKKNFTIFEQKSWRFYWVLFSPSFHYPSIFDHINYLSIFSLIQSSSLIGRGCRLRLLGRCLLVLSLVGQPLSRLLLVESSGNGRGWRQYPRWKCLYWRL